MSHRPHSFEQQQFLDVIDRDEAERRFHAALDLRPLAVEEIALADALGRVLAADVVAEIDVPSFDRSNVDGFAVRAEDTYGAMEESPRVLRLNAETIPTGVVPQTEVQPGTATAIATGAVVPRGADAVVMVEHTEVRGGGSAGQAGGATLLVTRPASPGAHVTFAGTDIARGETVLRAGTRLTSRETGVLAAIGRDRVSAFRRPRVGILSTGDEIVAPGVAMRPGFIYDSNAQVLADAVRELGGEPVRYGIVPDDEPALEAAVRRALGECDIVLLSGGTSKGAGDLSYRVVSRLPPPGIVAHGVALKPGKPICLAVCGQRRAQRAAGGAGGVGAGRRDSPSPLVGEGRCGGAARPIPVVILPGFPTSAVFTFHEFVAPVIRAFAGVAGPAALRGAREAATSVEAVLPVRVNSERGRTEYLLVGLVRRTNAPGETSASPSPTRPLAHSPYAAYPMGKGSGSVTAFAQADGFITIGRHEELLEAGTAVRVQLLGRDLQPADLVVIGSHCVGLDLLLGKLHERGITSKFLAVGSTGGLAAAKRGECDLAGIHLLDPQSGEYNRPFLSDDLELIPGYGRMQGIVYRRGDARFEGKPAEDAIRALLEAMQGAPPQQPDVRRTTLSPLPRMVNRNTGSGTRILIDRLLAGSLTRGRGQREGQGAVKPPGYAVQPRRHNAVAAAVSQGRADWGVAIETVARAAGLGFLPLAAERFDFVVPRSRLELPAVRAFRETLSDQEVRVHLRALGFMLD